MTIRKLVEERGESYGPPAENHARTAALWNAYLRSRQMANVSTVIFNPTDVCFLNLLQKVARCMGPNGPSKDSLTDIQGYAENLLILYDMVE